MYSIKETVQGEFIAKNSKFLGFLIPVVSEDLVSEILQKLRRDYPGASHYCYAYIVGDTGASQKASDDGEPQKTAGIPLLEVLKKNGLTNVLAVSIRYFGGTLLGASGLIRAYSKSISSLLELVIKTSKKEFIRYATSIDYSTHNHLENYFKSNVIVEKITYLENVDIVFSVLKVDRDSVKQHLDEVLFGNSNLTLLEEYSIYSED